MPAALPLLTKISQQSTSKRVYRTLTANYGDGNSESRPDGINDVVDTVQIQYVNLSPTELATLKAFFDSVKGSDYVTWTNVIEGDSAPRKYKIDMSQGRSTSITAGNAYNVSFTLQSYFGF